jgi:hypothetical protein
LTCWGAWVIFYIIYTSSIHQQKAAGKQILNWWLGLELLFHVSQPFWLPIYKHMTTIITPRSSAQRMKRGKKTHIPSAMSGYGIWDMSGYVGI